MNRCPRGHDKNIEGTAYGRCRRCKTDSQAARRKAVPDGRMKPCVHENACQLAKTSTGSRYCVTQRRMSARDPQTTAALRAALTADGWEDEFGPVEPVPAGYVDWVAEAREGRFEPRQRVSAPLRSSVEGRIGSSHSSGKRPAYRGLRAGA